MLRRQHGVVAKILGRSAGVEERMGSAPPRVSRSGHLDILKFAATSHKLLLFFIAVFDQILRPQVSTENYRVEDPSYTTYPANPG
jgi:hypothetical protein